MDPKLRILCDGSHNTSKKEAAVVQEFAQLRKVLRKQICKNRASLGPFAATTC